jgi:signal transduction histidine kinase
VIRRLQRIYFLFAGRSFKNSDTERLFRAKYQEDGVEMVPIFFYMAGLSFFGFSAVEVFGYGRPLTERIQWVRPLVALAFVIGGLTFKYRIELYRRFFQPIVCVWLVVYSAFILWFEFAAQIPGHPEFFYLSVTAMCLLLTVSCYYFMHLSVPVAGVMSVIFLAMSLTVINLSDVGHDSSTYRMITYIIVANMTGMLMRQISDRRQRYLFVRQKRLREMTSIQARLIEAQAIGMQAKMKFIAMLSHEMRTPVNAVVHAMEVVRLDMKGELTEKRMEMLRKVDGRCQQLLRTFDDLLDLGAMSEQIKRPAVTEFNLVDLVAQCVQLIEEYAVEKGLSLVVNIDRNLQHSCYMGPASALRRVLSNLMANAVKFTSKGGVAVSINLVETMALEERVEFSVSDTGIGIAAEELENIFQPFYQVESSLSRRFGGNGLGLAICQQLAGSMSALLLVDSEVGRGSCFKVIISLAPLSAVQKIEVA